MGADNRHETLIKAITDLGQDRGGRSWNEGKFDWHTAAEAINALSPSRARQLTVSMVAVLLDRSEKQATRVLRGPPEAGSFHAEHHRPADYNQIMKAGSAYGGKLVKRARWVYHRDRVKAWWGSRQRLQTNTKEQREQQKKLDRLMKERSDLVDLLRRKSDELAQVDRALAELRMLNLFAANSTLKAALDEQQPWIVDPAGRLRDNAWLPVSATDEITELLDAGGDIEWMPLMRALTDRAWESESVREAWVAVWLALALRAQVTIDASRAAARYERLSALEESVMTRGEERKRS